MKKSLFLIVVLFLLSGHLLADDVQVDTILYDRNWKCVLHNAFATYYRIYEIDALKKVKAYRGFYITGELQSEGNYISIDKNNDNCSVFDGKCINYYKSGKIEEVTYWENGEKEGNCVQYYENGLIKRNVQMKNGKMNGISTYFSEDGKTCKQIEMEDGAPKYDYYVVSNQDGFIGKYHINDNTQIWESPNVSEKKTCYVDGKSCSFYSKNGVMISMLNAQLEDYGDWFQISLLISNKTMSPFDIDPSKIRAYLINEETKEKEPLVVYSSDKYLNKVKNAQNWRMFFTALGQGIAVADAGYSSSVNHSTTNTNVYGTTSNVYGTSNTTSVSVSYDAAAAYQANVIANNRIANTEQLLLENRKIKEEGYLKRTTIYPGESVSGYLNIKQAKGSTMEVVVDINGAKYAFKWILKKGDGYLLSANEILPNKKFPELHYLPPFPCEAEITDIMNEKYKIYVYSLDSDYIIFKKMTEKGKFHGPMQSVRCEKIMDIKFKND